ncbi:MAG: cob(I)yrinic acid a,c-diamide adenosyltransferase [Dehalococcoidales bacterium]|nr:cob(I)yrinic acid a,c-diamide adenosyltransferase [Dehalococcoidales bacterium]
MSDKASYSPLAPEPLPRGLVQVFTGDGKGKTSAAIGAVIRALGHGRKVYIAFFMKGAHPSGEFHILSQLSSVTMASFGSGGFIDPRNVRAEDREGAAKALAAARQAVLKGSYDLVVLDEVNVAVAFGLIPVDDVLKLIEEKPKGVELILTGRRADTRLVQAADLVTECLKIKHPYDTGVAARGGIEF